MDCYAFRSGALLLTPVIRYGKREEVHCHAKPHCQSVCSDPGKPRFGFHGLGILDVLQSIASAIESVRSFRPVMGQPLVG
jgi:hypothetical protein